MDIKVLWNVPDACGSIKDSTGLICTSKGVLVTETETGRLPDGAIDGVGLGAFVYVLRSREEKNEEKK